MFALWVLVSHKLHKNTFLSSLRARSLICRELCFLSAPVCSETAAVTSVQRTADTSQLGWSFITETINCPKSLNAQWKAFLWHHTWHNPINACQCLILCETNRSLGSLQATALEVLKRRLVFQFMFMKHIYDNETPVSSDSTHCRVRPLQQLQTYRCRRKPRKPTQSPIPDGCVCMCVCTECVCWNEGGDT